MATYFLYHLIIREKKTNDIELIFEYPASSPESAKQKALDFLYRENYDSESYTHEIKCEGKPHQYDPTVYYLVYTPKRKGAKRKIYKSALEDKYNLKALEELRNEMSKISPFNVWEIYTGNWRKVIDKYGDLVIPYE